MAILRSIRKQVSYLSRSQKTDEFYSLFKEGMSVLDVGVSSERHAVLPTTNYFLKTFKYDSKYYTGLGIDDLSKMGQMYPGKRFVRYPGDRFPFADKEYDWVFSNAVIEHVGDADAQLVFLNEMLRVGRNVFFTTPNKFFPVEAHTGVFFLHWSDSIFHNWCRKRHPWVSRFNPYLFSFSRLAKMLDLSQGTTYMIRKNRFLGFPMTFTVVCSGK